LNEVIKKKDHKVLELKNQLLNQNDLASVLEIIKNEQKKMKKFKHMEMS
jgi:hypothetical protein